MSIGSGLCVIGRAERMGLGSMTEDFCRAFIPDRAIILDRMTGRTISPDGIIAKEVITLTTAELNRKLPELLRGLNTVVGFETWYSDYVTQHCTPRKIRTVMFPMWEWSPDSVKTSSKLITLSETDRAHFPNGLQGWWPPSPAVKALEQRELQWPPKVFVHCAGNASHNRDGTEQVLQAAEHLVGTGAKLLLFSAFDAYRKYADLLNGITHQEVIEFRAPVKDRADLYREADVLVCPRRIGGHSLPINEAQGLGLPVVCLNTMDWREFPYTVPAHAQPRERFGRSFCDTFRADPEELGICLRNMAIGNVSLVPGPALPSWEEFKLWWTTNVLNG